MSKVRISISNNDKITDKRAVIVSRDLEDIQKQAKNKLNIKKKIVKVFNGETGEEITSNEQLKDLKQDDLIVVSTNKDKAFLGKVASDELEPDSSTIDPEGIDQEDHEKQMNELKKNVVVKVLIKDAWLEDEAIKQLNKVAATLRGIRYAIGMPDLHPGKGFPIGASYATKHYIYPHLIGSDIGCGMSMFKTDLSSTKVRLDSWVNKLYGLETGGILEDVDNQITVEEWLEKFNVERTSHDDTLGSIGGGNHFAELQQVEKVVDENAFEELGLNADSLYLLVHSGSRGLGHQILRDHEDKFRTKGFHEDTPECKEYMHKHDNACRWAKANRHLIAHKFFSCLGTNGDIVLDIWHNNVEQRVFVNEEQEEKPQEEEVLWLHRKGAAPTDKGCVVIPGSRGSYSYLVTAADEIKDAQLSAYSCAHGAGRRWNRSKAYNMSKNNPNQTPDSLSVTELGSRVICEDNQLLYEEHPFAYKDIDEVVKDLVEFKVIKVIAVMKPLITYKTRATKSK